MTRIALMVALTAVAAQISIPLPFSPVPFTMQVFAVILTGLLLGPRYGAIAQGVYVLVGAVGVPVFSQFQGGLGVLAGPKGGYDIAYPIAAAIAGLAFSASLSYGKRALPANFLFGCAGLAVIYAFGAAWLSFVANLPPAVALAQGVLPFVVFDLVKVGLAAAVAVAVVPAISPQRT